MAPADALNDGPEALAQVEDLLERLRKIDPRLRTVVELRVFEGKTADETAEAMGCSVRSVHTYWRFATHWLSKELEANRRSDKTESRPGDCLPGRERRFPI